MKALAMMMVMMLVVCFGFNAEAATHKIKCGDTLSKISQKTGVSVVEIAKANNINKRGFKSLRVGRVLTIPEKVSAKAAPVQTEKVAKAEAVTSETQQVEVQNLTSTATMQAAPASSENHTLQPVKKVAVRQQTNDEQETQALLKKLASQSQETTANLQKASEQRLTASTEEPYNIPVKWDNRLKTVTAPFKFGKSFNEVGLTAGGYVGDNSLAGGYFIAEANHWIEQENAGRNFSFLGGFVMYEPGKIDGGYNWNKVKLLYQPGLYETFDEQESYHLLIKPRVGVSINFGTEKETNLTYGAYAELDKIFDPRNRAGVVFDAMLEVRDRGTDGQINPRLFYEKGFGDEGKSVIFSAGPIWHITPDETNSGVAGSLGYRVPVDDEFAWQLAVTADVTKDSTTVGAFVSATWDDIMHVFQKKGR